MLTVMGILARRKGWEIEGARVSVDKDMVADPVRRIGQLVLRFEMPAGIPEDARKLARARRPHLPRPPEPPPRREDRDDLRVGVTKGTFLFGHFRCGKRPSDGKGTSPS